MSMSDPQAHHERGLPASVATSYFVNAEQKQVLKGLNGLPGQL